MHHANLFLAAATVLFGSVTALWAEPLPASNATEISTRGRHDPCLLPRFVVMGEAMVALVLVDHWLRWKAQCGRVDSPSAKR